MNIAVSILEVSRTLFTNRSYGVTMELLLLNMTSSFLLLQLQRAELVQCRVLNRFYTRFDQFHIDWEKWKMGKID